ncbi:PREDICTED: diffuse panbronchiolitis critical region protein 1 [Capra hircus]|uniref:diffuse panbronchiolitis critical region protein 1 n=1 Tax=Capra hircus TaxID=9925 RepID=UPI000846D7BA|nr:PREDICTED: diffuse panbronchiolitis critical region protein 1 [Capra hircus]
MAQPAHCIRSVFGLQCFFLFLLTSQEAGAAALQELQKTGKSTSDHLFSLAPALVSITPSNHAALHSEHSSPDPLISTETHKPKHQCTTTHRSKLAHQSSTTQAAPPAAEQNPSKQGRGPIIRNERASEPKDTANTDQGSDGERHTTPVPNRKSTTCLKRTTSRSTVTSKPAKVVTPSTTSNKTTEKTKQNLGKVTDRKQSTTRGHERTSGSPEKSTEHEGKTTGDNKRVTGASEKSTGHEEKTTSNHERTTETSVGTGHGEKITSGHERTTGSPETPTGHEGKTTSNHERTTETSVGTGHGEKITSGHERTTGSPETPTEHEGKTTGTHYKTTGGSAKSTRHQEKTTSVTETIKAPIKLTENPAKNTAATENIRPAVKVTGDASISTTSPCTSNTDASRCVPTGSSTPPRSIVSEAPDNKSHPQQNKDDSQGGVHEGETEGTDSFPAWAIVVVILLSVILLLVFIGLIVLASYLARTRRALIQNTENNDSENAGGSNSYPVYLMEQQTFGPSQTPGPR